MGGKGSGGLRVGAGRKSKGAALLALEGGRDRPDKRPPKPKLPPIETFAPPENLTRAELQVWGDLASHAFAARTLTRATLLGFVMLCRNVVLEREIAADKDLRGGANHRGLIQRVDAELARFCLAPLGKPLIPEEVPDADPFARFDHGQSTH